MGLRAAVLAGSGLLPGCDGVNTGVHWEFERMIVQPRYEAYEENTFFDDGRDMRTPPAGTVPRGAALGPAAVVRGAEDGVPVARIPVPLTPALLETGRRRFEIVCAACHGLLGDGRSVVASKMQLRQPPSLHLERIRGLPPGRVFQVVREGYGLMPANGSQLTVEETWGIVAYVRALQLSQEVRLDALPPAIRAEALRALGAATGPGQGVQR